VADTNQPAEEPVNQPVENTPEVNPAPEPKKTTKPASKPAAKKAPAPKADVPAAKADAPAEPAKPVAQSNATPAAAVVTAEPRNRRSLIIKVVAVVGGVAVILLAVFAVLIYKYQNDSSVVRAAANVVPYPVESVNGHLVSYNDYLFELNTYKNYLVSQGGQNGQPAVNFNTASGKAQLKQIKQQVLSQLKTNAVVTQLAADKKVKVSNKEINDEVAKLSKQAGGDAKLKQVLQQVYGWNLGDLKRKLRFQLLQQKLQTAVTSDPKALAQAKAKAQDVLNQVKAGGDFATLAKKYSMDSGTASNGGDLGFFDSTSGLDQTFYNAAAALQPGQVSDLVKTQFGFHIIKVVEKDGAKIHAAHILIQPVDFNSYLNDQVKKAKSSVYVHVK
jgi:hypothetical protein